MMKVRILDQCEFCDGEAYIFVCEDVDVPWVSVSGDQVFLPTSPLSRFEGFV